MWNWDTTWGLLKRVFKGKGTSWGIISLIHCFANTQSNIVGKEKGYSRHVQMECLQTFTSFKTLFCSCWKLLFHLANWAGFQSSLPPHLNFFAYPQRWCTDKWIFSSLIHMLSTHISILVPALAVFGSFLKSWVSAVTPFPHCNWRW